MEIKTKYEVGEKVYGLRLERCERGRKSDNKLLIPFRGKIDSIQIYDSGIKYNIFELDECGNPILDGLNAYLQVEEYVSRTIEEAYEAAKIAVLKSKEKGVY